MVSNTIVRKDVWVQVPHPALFAHPPGTLRSPDLPRVGRTDKSEAHDDPRRRRYSHRAGSGRISPAGFHDGQDLRVTCVFEHRLVEARRISSPHGPGHAHERALDRTETWHHHADRTTQLCAAGPRIPVQTSESVRFRLGYERRGRLTLPILATNLRSAVSPETPLLRAARTGPGNGGITCALAPWRRWQPSVS